MQCSHYFLDSWAASLKNRAKETKGRWLSPFSFALMPVILVVNFRESQAQPRIEGHAATL